MAELIYPDGSKKIVHPKDGKSFDHTEISELLGCSMIDVVRGDRIPDGMVMFCDDEGAIIQDPQNNPMAELISGYEPLFGRVLYMTDVESGDA